MLIKFCFSVLLTRLAEQEEALNVDDKEFKFKTYLFNYM